MTVTVNDADIFQVPITPITKFIVVHTGNRVTWSDHIRFIAAKMAMDPILIGVLGSTPYLLPPNIRLIFYYSLV